MQKFVLTATSWPPGTESHTEGTHLGAGRSLSTRRSRAPSVPGKGTRGEPCAVPEPSLSRARGPVALHGAVRTVTAASPHGSHGPAPEPLASSRAPGPSSEGSPNAPQNHPRLPCRSLPPGTAKSRQPGAPRRGAPGRSAPAPPLTPQRPAALPPAHTWLWACDPRTARSRKQSPFPCECRRLPCPPPSTGPRKAAPTFRELATVGNADCQQGHAGRPWTPPRPTRTLTQAARSHCGEGVKE